MLINAVLVYVRELLPVFILLALLLHLDQQRQWQLPIQAFFIAALSMLMLAPWLGDITQLFEGNGLELLFALLLLITLVALFFVLPSCNYRHLAAMLIIVVQTLVSGINLLLYGLTSIGVDGATESVWLGAILGIGICLSVTVLCYQLLAELERMGNVIVVTMLALIAARQTSEIIVLLEQIDWLAQGQALWDTSQFITEQSALGVFFHVWFGYESTPDATQLGSWVLTFILMLIFWLWRRQKL
uniref:Uncharacterized protein n=1 Tax=Rheinheimera sp. BAL341 TaxID=1708203 RepID=A0A486XGN4_9GAMM